jgi:hypothetical protein
VDAWRRSGRLPAGRSGRVPLPTNKANNSAPYGCSRAWQRKRQILGRLAAAGASLAAASAVSWLVQGAFATLGVVWGWALVPLHVATATAVCCWFVGLLLLGVAAYQTRLPGRLRVMPLAVVALVPASVLLPAFTTVGMPLVTSLPFIGAALLGWFLLGSIDGDGLAAPARAESGIATATRSAAGTVSSGVGKMRSVRREREGGAGGAPAARGAGGGGGCP